MSLNIHFYAIREIVPVKTGKVEMQEIRLKTFQTNTEESRQIYSSKNPVKSYADWLKNRNWFEEETVFEITEDYDEIPVGTKMVNEGRKEAAWFLREVRKLRSRGFEIIAEVW